PPPPPATGCSCGVDSFYTIYTKTRCSVKKYNLTHLLVSSTGFHDTNDDREAIAKEFTKILHRVKSLAQNIGLDTLGCFTNLDTFYKFFQPPYVAFYYFYATNLGSIAFALQKFLDVYYHSSTYSYEDLALHKLMSYGGSLDGSFFDLFALPCMSTQNLTFYSCDSGKTRVEKEAAIADFEPAQKYLSVCSDEQDGGDNHGMNNCSHCEKCLRTMAGFYALGKLDNFSKVFDVQGYKKDLSRRLGWWLGSKNGAFQREFLDYAAQNNVHIPAGVYVWKGIAKFWKAMYKVFGNVRFIRKILYALKLDYLIKGYRSGYAHKKYGV
ncbi:MAG: hypothetical protein IJP54_00840, partial [Synergistaceae bacterium]|nr:hypothetical protein [Synergistaceae bacterium]